MSFLLDSMISLRELAHSRSFEAATRDPARAQAEVLRALLAHNADTAFGRAHGFSRIAAAAQYGRAIPIADYEVFRPFVKRIIVGEKRVLTADEPYMFTTTSGTTGEPKLLPVSIKWREQMAALTRLWLVRALRDHPGCLGTQGADGRKPCDRGRNRHGDAVWRDVWRHLPAYPLGDSASLRPALRNLSNRRLCGAILPRDAHCDG